MTYECTCGWEPEDIIEIVTHYADCDGRLTAASLSSNERATLVYIESCVVDQDAVLAPGRMNHIDYQNIKVFQAAGLLSLDDDVEVADFTDDAWDLAHECRRLRADE